MCIRDRATKIGLADVLREGAEAGDPELDRARKLLEDVAGLGRENGLQWFVTAVYKRSGIANEYDEGEEAYRGWRDLYDSLLEQGFKAVLERAKVRGELRTQAAPARLARLLTSTVYGFGVLSRLPGSGPRIGDAVAGMLELIDSVAVDT